jgi:colanic acid biosynthesis glycosyl transferase WcaI
VKLLFVNQHYPPDGGATGKLLAQLSRELAKSGPEVTVLTGWPTYEEAKGTKAPREEMREGVRVIRLPLLPRWKSPFGRMLHYLSFAISLLGRASFLPRPDCIVAFSTTPMFGGAAVRLLSRWKRTPFLYVVQDVHPEIAVALGLLKSRALETLARFLETLAWRGAARVILIGDDLAPMARARGVDASRLAVIPNWADPEEILPLSRSGFRRELGIGDDEFVVEYAGNLGHSQDLEAVLEAARAVVKKAARPVRFLFVGGGALEGDLAREASRVPGAIVVPFQPEERLSEVLSAADLSLVPLKRGLSRFCVPSKVYSILASGRPVGALVDPDSEIARIVVESDCGFRVDPADSGALENEILLLSGNPARAARLGRNSRAYGEREGSLARAAQAYQKVIHEAIGCQLS